MSCQGCTCHPRADRVALDRDVVLELEQLAIAARVAWRESPADELRTERLAELDVLIDRVKTAIRGADQCASA